MGLMEDATRHIVVCHEDLNALRDQVAELTTKLATAEESITRHCQLNHQVVGELAAMTRNRDELANVVKSRDDEIANFKAIVRGACAEHREPK